MIQIIKHESIEKFVMWNISGNIFTLVCMISIMLGSRRAFIFSYFRTLPEISPGLFVDKTLGVE